MLQALNLEGSLSRCTLSRLDTAAIGRLIQILLEDNCPALNKRLVRESKGVPLDLAETLKLWRDEGHLRPQARNVELVWMVTEQSAITPGRDHDGPKEG